MTDNDLGLFHWDCSRYWKLLKDTSRPLGRSCTHPVGMWMVLVVVAVNTGASRLPSEATIYDRHNRMLVASVVEYMQDTLVL